MHLKVGITGGIGSGKSIATKIFSLLGIPVYDADSRAKWLMNYDPILKSLITNEFGEESFTPEGLNRKYMAGVFSDKEKLDHLNSLVHPAVAKDFEKWDACQSNVKYTLKEAALLYESGSYKTLDRVIVVTAPVKLRIKRVLLRDPFRTEDQILKIIEKQLPQNVKVEQADFLINNDDSQLVIPQILEIHEKLVKNLA